MRRAALVALCALSGVRTVHADGLHAVGRVRPVEPGPAISLALASGYGFTGAVLKDGDAHHRALGSAALAVRPIAWLELGGAVTGRYDKHTGSEADDGLVGDPRLWATAGGDVGGGKALALRVGLWLPGADAPSIEWDAATVDASAVFTARAGALAFTATAGYRLDRSTAAVDPVHLSKADRLGLGLSDADAALLGVGLTRRSGPWQLVGEASGDLLIGAGAPPVSQSPWRLGAGVRRALDGAFTAEAMIEVAASARPDYTAMDPAVLVAVEPRVAIGVGLAWRPAAPARTPTVVPHDEVVKVEPPPPPPPAPTTGTVRGTIVDDQGPLPGATITIASTTVQTGDDGTFTIPDFIAGDFDVTVSRDGYQPDQRKLTVVAGAGAQLDVTLVRAKLPSQIRGLIRGFDGKGLPAHVRIEPAGVEVTAGADGRFTVDLPPGTYTLVIELPGYRGQRREVVLEDEGVLQPSIELQKARR